MEKQGMGRELESVANLFISSGEEEAPVKEMYEVKENTSGQKEVDFEVEETIKIRKKIAYPETEKAQENMKRRLFQLFQEGYTINRVELKKNTHTHKLKNRKVTTEEIIIFLKTSSPD
jgi:hypothetical protein